MTKLAIYFRSLHLFYDIFSNCPQSRDIVLKVRKRANFLVRFNWGQQIRYWLLSSPEGSDICDICRRNTTRYPISKAIVGKWYLRRIRWTLPDCQSIRGNQLYHTLSDWEPPPSPHTILDFLQVPPPWKISLENYSFFREPPFYVDRSTGCKKVIQIGILLCKRNKIW